MDKNDRAAVERLMGYLRTSPTPFHAVDNAVAHLDAAGFERLAEDAPWSLKRNGRYYVTRNGSSITAFIPGTDPVTEAGFHVIGAHTDSPNLRLKPRPEIRAHGYTQLGVEVYGSALLASWTDRDLGLAGRVVVDQDGTPVTRLLRADRPVGRIPQIAIHLDREVNTKGLILNKETQLPPVVGLSEEDGSFEKWLGAELDVDPARILAHELMFFEVTPPVLSGLDGEFLHSGRLDNLASCHAALTALTEAAATAVGATRVVILYDNEEVGSSTMQGAAGSFLADLLSRITEAGGRGGEALHRSRSRSFLVSADMAHAVHPNYADRHDSRHLPRLNRGPVIKVNANARYATDAETSARFQQLCEQAEVPYQKFVMRADLPCGSTIGPIVSSRLGIKAVDVGNPMLSMHSCREMAGAADHGPMIRVLTRFLSR